MLSVMAIAAAGFLLSVCLSTRNLNANDTTAVGSVDPFRSDARDRFLAP